MKKEQILVSACLFGKNCKYSGGNNKISDNLIKDISKKYDVKLICPEELGGLETPREPAEIRSGKVYTKSGKDVTKNFIKGAKIVLETAKKHDIKLAILKSNSPSCSSGHIYDGTFSSKLIKGKGMTADLLIKNEIKVIDENDI